MLLVAVLGLIGLVEPGPLDASRANIAESKAEMRFECKYFLLQANDPFVERLLDCDPGTGPAADPAYVLDGRWESDGSSELHILRVVGGTNHVEGSTSGPVQPCEILCDEEFYAFHLLYPREKVLHVNRPGSSPCTLVGPFSWFGNYRFDRDIDNLHLAAGDRRRRSAVKCGVPTEVEIYTKKYADFTIIREIYYDPNLGYLPRFYRSLVTATEDSKISASIKEMYLVDASPCSAGGIVPREWYLIFYDLDDFGRTLPSYSEDTRLLPEGRCTVAHFKATSFKDKAGPVTLREAGKLNRIFAPGGMERLKANRPALTASRVKQYVKTKMNPANETIVPNIDRAEVEEFARNGGTSRARRIFSISIVATSVLGLCWMLRRWYLRASGACAAGPTPSSGGVPIGQGQRLDRSR